MNRFGFLDSSGIIKQDRFFGTGLLVIKDVGPMSEYLFKNYQTAQNVVKANKDNAIDTLIRENKVDEVVNLLRKHKRFELKFDNLRPSTFPFYHKMIEIFFSSSENRFAAMIVDKENPSFDAKRINDSWDAYIGFSASLVHREMRNFKHDGICLIVDEITKPNCKALPLEDELVRKLSHKIKNGEKELDISCDNIYGAISIESHSNQLMQLNDVLLGIVMYDFKKRAGLISHKVEKKKERLVEEARNKLTIDTLAQDFTKHSPSYFSVFQPVWKSNK